MGTEPTNNKIPTAEITKPRVLSQQHLGKMRDERVNKAKNRMVTSVDTKICPLC